MIPIVVLKKEPEGTQEKIKEINKVNEELTTENIKLCEDNKQLTEKNKKLLEEESGLLVSRIHLGTASCPN